MQGDVSPARVTRSDKSWPGSHSICLGPGCQRNVVPIWRLNAEQIMHEIVIAIVLGRQYPHSMILSGNEEHVEVLVSLDQRIHYLKRGRRIDVAIQSRRQ